MTKTKNKKKSSHLCPACRGEIKRSQKGKCSICGTKIKYKRTRTTKGFTGRFILDGKLTTKAVQLRSVVLLEDEEMKLVYSRSGVVTIEKSRSATGETVQEKYRATYSGRDMTGKFLICPKCQVKMFQNTLARGLLNYKCKNCRANIEYIFN